MVPKSAAKPLPQIILPPLQPKVVLPPHNRVNADNVAGKKRPADNMDSADTRQRTDTDDASHCADKRQKTDTDDANLSTVTIFRKCVIAFSYTG